MDEHRGGNAPKPPRHDGACGRHRLCDALAHELLDAFTKADATYIFVTNEIGLGGISADTLQRKFTDLQGWMNQYIADKADEVILMVSGIEVKIKSLTP